MTTENFSELLDSLIKQTLVAGADAADARIASSQGLNVEVRNGSLESVERDEVRGVSLRALVGKRQAHVSGSDTSPDGLKALATRVAEMARVAPEDPYCGLPDPSELAREEIDLELEGDEATPVEELERRALEAEAAALEIDKIQPTGQAGASWSVGETHVASSNGFAASRSGGMTSLWVLAIAEEDGVMERDHDSSTKRKYAQIQDGREIGLSAAKRAVGRLGARKVDSCTAPVIFDNRLSNRLVGAFVSAISGPAIARGVSFLRESLGRQVFAEGVNIIDEPLRKGGFASRWFDGEGRPVSKTALIEDGVLTQWILSGPSALQLGLKPNGFASTGFGDPPGVSTSNLDLQPGTLNLAELMKDADKGLYITDMFGPSLNPNTGDYSVGVSGYWFENGEISYPVNEVTVAGDLPGMFRRLIPGADLEIRGATNAPSVLIDGMTLAGN